MRNAFPTLSADVLRERHKDGDLRGFCYVDNDDYHRTEPVCSSSFVKRCLRSPAHAIHEAAHHKDTPALRFGTALHAAILEPLKFRQDYIVEPRWKHKGTVKAGKAERAAWRASSYEDHAAINRSHVWPPGAPPIILTAAEGAQLLAMQAAAMRSTTYQWLMAEPLVELAAYWTDPATGLGCKAKLDAWCRGDIILDLKSTIDGARADEFARTIIDYGYHISAAHYADGVEQLTGDGQSFIWLVMEKQPPYGIMFYLATPRMMELGRIERDRGLMAYKTALENGLLERVYDDAIVSIDLPHWYAKRIENDQ